MPTSQVVGWQCFNICIVHLRYLSSTTADYDCGAQASDSSCLASPQMPEVPTLSSYKRTVACNPALQSLAGARRVLLLQGPLGPFFDRLARWLIRRGVHVERVAFQGGDVLDAQLLPPILYTGTSEAWAGHVRTMLQDGQFDHIVLFGQSRSYHSTAIQQARALGVVVVVMEEGYFRPGFATMELDGVNGYSRTLDQFEWHPDPAVSFPHGAPALSLPLAGPVQPHDCEHHFRKMAWFASRHYLALRKQAQRFPHYVHHKESNPYWYARYWVWSWCKKYWYRGRDARGQRYLLSTGVRYFFVPLQHDGDAQITHHSRFRENTRFIIEVMRSFGQYAPRDALLVFRQHPFSRGGAGHVNLIRALAAEMDCADRVCHMVEGDTPLLAQHSQGVVLINSTVGLQALERGAPLIALGEALYNREGLTFQHGLDRFWAEGRPAQLDVMAYFVAQMRNLTQVPVSLYAERSQELTWQ